VGSPLAAADRDWLQRVCRGVGLMTMLLPWLWLPLAWPLVVIGGWWATAANPAGPRRGGWARPTLRLLLPIILISSPTATYSWMRHEMLWQPHHVLFPFFATVIPLLAWIVLVALMLGLEVGGRGLRKLRRVFISLWLAAVGGATLAALLDLTSLNAVADIVALLGLASAGCALGGVVLIPLLLVRLWRELDRSLLQPKWPGGLRGTLPGAQ
jgi:hypothetical protein